MKLSMVRRYTRQTLDVSLYILYNCVQSSHLGNMMEIDGEDEINVLTIAWSYSRVRVHHFDPPIPPLLQSPALFFVFQNSTINAMNFSSNHECKRCSLLQNAKFIQPTPSWHCCWVVLSCRICRTDAWSASSACQLCVCVLIQIEMFVLK